MLLKKKNILLWFCPPFEIFSWIYRCKLGKRCWRFVADNNNNNNNHLPWEVEVAVPARRDALCEVSLPKTPPLFISIIPSPSIEHVKSQMCTNPNLVEWYTQATTPNCMYQGTPGTGIGGQITHSWIRVHIALLLNAAGLHNVDARPTGLLKRPHSPHSHSSNSSRAPCQLDRTSGMTSKREATFFALWQGV